MVSSPQGNATNCSSVLLSNLEEITFQVPKGMLQTFHAINGFENQVRFQVPKGMLQTLTSKILLVGQVLFQVPKGMLQTNKYAFRVYDQGLFQVPKGMLQTKHYENLRLNLNGFKSPRECYKLEVLQWGRSPSLASFKSPRECYKHYSITINQRLYKTFQVPKGMLQTDK